MIRIQKEMSEMIQSREAREMILQEKYYQMDWNTYGSEQREAGYANGMATGQDELSEALKELYQREENQLAIDAIMDKKAREKILVDYRARKQGMTAATT